MIPLVAALCHQTARLVAPTEDGWAFEGKIDGWSCLIERTLTGIRLVNGRNASDYSGKLPYLEQSLMGLSVGTILHGELVANITSASGHGSSAVGSVMRRTVTHRPTPQNPALTLVVFDALALGDPDSGEIHDLRRRPWHERRRLIEVLGCLDHVEVSQLFTGPDPLGQALALGLEGLVCKRTDSPYVPGRSSYWQKIKPQLSAEAVIVGFKPGKVGGQWDGMVGAFELQMLDADGQPTNVFTTAKCRGDAMHYSATRERDAIAEGLDPSPEDRWLGCIVELLHNGLSKTGVPRHPMIAGRRDDLPRPLGRVVGTINGAPVFAARPTERTGPVTGQTSGRNYARMTTPGKLAACIAELRAGEGPAYDRCVARDGDPDADLAAALKAARDLKIAVTT